MQKKWLRKVKNTFFGFKKNFKRQRNPGCIQIYGKGSVKVSINIFFSGTSPIFEVNFIMGCWW